MARRQLNDKRVVLTGASSGIGSALAAELSRRGARLLITARRADRLQAVANRLGSAEQEVLVVAGDLTDLATQAAIVQVVQQRWSGIDLLINNAGIGALGPFAMASSSRMRRVMEVNFMAPVELIRLCLPWLRLGNQPMIVNVSSVLGYRAMPNKSEYCASKFALCGFSSALRAELARESIDVLVVSPSTTQSEFFDRVIESPASTSRKSFGLMPAERVAQLACDAMERGRAEVVLSWGGKGLVWLNRWFPSLMDRFAEKFGQ